MYIFLFLSLGAASQLNLRSPTGYERLQPVEQKSTARNLPAAGGQPTVEL